MNIYKHFPPLSHPFPPDGPDLEQSIEYGLEVIAVICGDIDAVSGVLDGTVVIRVVQVEPVSV